MNGLLGRLDRLPIATALRETLREGYSRKQLTADVLAGVVVGIIALPLAMALAIGTGVAPQHGLYTAMIAGILIALFGGSRGNVSGPTAAFIVILHPIVTQYGLGGLLVATVMAGIILVLMGLGGLGRFIEYIPYPVTTGFTAGIGVVIALMQVPDFFGLTMGETPAHFFDRLLSIARALPSAHWPDLLIGAVCLAVLIYWPRLKSVVPGHLVAVVLGSLLALLLGTVVDGFEVATIGSRFSYQADGVSQPGIPPYLPGLQWPWHWPGANGEPFVLSFTVIQDLMAPAFAIAILGAIESLLCAVVVDSFLRTKHNPNAELVGQGIGNIVAPFFGGISATGAIARSAAGIRAGARSPVSAIVHGVVILLAIVSLARLLAYVPMAALAALLLMTAWNMSEAKHFVNVLKIGPMHDKAVLVTCFVLTVVFDMVVAVGVGMVLAAFLFMHRVAGLSVGRWLEDEHAAERHGALPPDARFYQIDGPLFFGATEKAISTLKLYAPGMRTVILWLGEVPMIDVTGVIALDSALRLLREQQVFVVLAGAKPNVRVLLESAGIGRDPAWAEYVDRADQAVRLAHRRYAAASGEASPVPEPV